jgi:hypothetical protein
MNFDPTTNGLTNSISGIGMLTENGEFKIDLTHADTTIGDVWQLVASTVAAPTGGIYGSDATFTVADTLQSFTNLGGGIWTDNAANGATYQFNESTGQLTVIPEPATIVMILTGFLGMGMFWLRKRS